jgi:hypothetical protein
LFTTKLLVDVFICGLSENAKPAARQGRKATDLPETAGLPEKGTRLFFMLSSESSETTLLKGKSRTNQAGILKIFSEI